MDRALLFVTGGYAGAEDQVSVPLAGISSTDWRSGGAFGGGIEYAFTNNISAKAEYIYAPFQSKTFAAGAEERPRSVARPRRPELQVLIGSIARDSKGPAGKPAGPFSCLRRR